MLNYFSTWVFVFFFTLGNLNGGDQLEQKEDDLDTADDGKPSEEPHGASDETQLGLRLDLLVPLHLVEGGRVKVDLHQLEGWLWQFLSWDDGNLDSKLKI